MILGLYVATKYVPSGRLGNNQNAPLGKSSVATPRIDIQAKKPVGEIVAGVLRNKPFLILMGVLLISGMGLGMWLALFFTYVDSYLGQGDAFTKIYAWSMATGALVMPVWYHLVLRWGKRNAYLLSSAMICSWQLRSPPCKQVCDSLQRSPNRRVLQMLQMLRHHRLKRSTNAGRYWTLTWRCTLPRF